MNVQPCLIIVLAYGLLECIGAPNDTNESLARWKVKTAEPYLLRFLKVEIGGWQFFITCIDFNAPAIELTLLVGN